jgi:hypothetical protein
MVDRLAWEMQLPEATSLLHSSGKTAAYILRTREGGWQRSWHMLCGGTG